MLLGGPLTQENAADILEQRFARLGLQVTGLAANQTATAEAFNALQADFNQYQGLVASVVRENEELRAKVSRLERESGRPAEASKKQDRPAGAKP